MDSARIDAAGLVSSGSGTVTDLAVRTGQQQAGKQRTGALSEPDLFSELGTDVFASARGRGPSAGRNR